MVRQIGSDQEEVVVNPEDIEGTSEDITELQASLDDEIQAIVGEFSIDPTDNNWKIHVKRIVPNKGVLEHCFSCTVAELPILERIKAEYGPGAYQCYILEGNKLRKKPTITIAEPLKKPVAEVIRESKQDLAGIVATMAEQQRETMRMVQESMMRQPQAPSSDPVTMMTAMMGAMVQMKEFLQPAQPAQDATTMFIKGLEVAKEITGAGDGKNFNDVVVSLGKELLPPIVRMAQKEQAATQQQVAMYGQPVPQQGAQPVQPQLQQPQENQQMPEQQQPQPQTQQMDPTATAAFKSQVDMLVLKAAAQSDPGLWADVILDSFEPSEIKQFLARPDLVAFLSQFNPGVTTYQQWFLELKAIVEDGLPEETASAGNLTPAAEGAIQPEITEESIEGVAETIDVIPDDAVKLDSESPQDT